MKIKNKISTLVILLFSIGFSGLSFAEYTEKDFYWDKKTTPHKAVIIAGVNKIHRENANCKTMDPSSAYISSSKGTPSNPVFFVTCDSASGSFNAFFSKSDVENEIQLGATKHINKKAALQACREYAQSKATHPSTVDFSTIMDLSIVEHPNGRTTVNSTFTAKNSLNLELKYSIRCLSDASGFFEGIINEAN